MDGGGQREKEKRMTVIRIEKELWKGDGADTGAMPTAMKYKGAEGRTAGHCCGSG